MPRSIGFQRMHMTYHGTSHLYPLIMIICNEYSTDRLYAARAKKCNQIT